MEVHVNVWISPDPGSPQNGSFPSYERGSRGCQDLSEGLTSDKLIWERSHRSVAPALPFVWKHGRAATSGSPLALGMAIRRSRCLFWFTGKPKLGSPQPSGSLAV